MDKRVKQDRKSLRITRVTTRVGDGGLTHLAGGRRVGKDHPRLDAYGTIDELQVAIGAARDVLGAALDDAGEPAARTRLALLGEHLIYIQNLLFTLGGDLATPLEDRQPPMPLIAPRDVQYLDRLIEAYNASLAPLKDFVLPGGHRVVTALHACRVICRRAERAIERLGKIEPVGEPVRPFVNRLSDVFFVLARDAHATLAAQGQAPAESIWRRDLPEPPMP